MNPEFFQVCVMHNPDIPHFLEELKSQGSSLLSSPPPQVLVYLYIAQLGIKAVTSMQAKSLIISYSF